MSVPFSVLDKYVDDVNYLRGLIKETEDGLKTHFESVSNRIHSKNEYPVKRYNLLTRDGFNGWCLAEFRRRFPNHNYIVEKPKCLINEFNVYTKDLDSFKKVCIFKKEEGVLDVIQNYLELDGDTSNYYHAPTGSWLRGKASIIETENRVFVKQGFILNW